MDTSNSNSEKIDYDKQDWLDALHEMLENEGADRVKDILHDLQVEAHRKGVRLPFSANTPYINTIPMDEQPAYPGDREMERRIKSLIRWNAMAMVVRANREEDGIGGHISSYQSIAAMYEVGFNHFFRGRTDSFPGDMVYFQGHSSPGVYARAYLEGRLNDDHLKNFRHELHDKPGLSSYPHPWLMPDFWQFPTVSMGLGPITAIYHARYIKYLEDRGLREPTDQHVWAFLGDGETDEPESLGALKLAAREKLDNLTFVVNCNLQRLDGPVSGNSKIIQELEAAFRGAGWNVIKVIWGDSWDPLLEKDESGMLVKRMGEVVDGQYQKYTVEDAEYVREHFFGAYPETAELAANLSDSEIKRMRRGGHDPAKIYAAYKKAVETKGRPTVILAKTVKGYGLGTAGEGQNITHSQKKMGEESLREFRTRFGLPISDEEIDDVPFYRPDDDSPEMEYLRQRRAALGGHVPTRLTDFNPIDMPADKIFQEFDAGSDRAVSTTMVFVRVLSKLLSDKNIGKLVVPIIPDEARTFGMDALFRQVGIYAHSGQLYEPVDADNLLYYKEAKDGQILEEGITEAGAFSSFVAAGTAYANHGINTIPFYTYYSMFGFQRIGDSAWLAGDSRCKGFLLGATAGRTTLAGEGLQHQDGHSLALALTYPNMVAYDPAFAYELALIIKDGIRRMYVDNEQIFYYITLMNDNYEQPAKPEGSDEGILKGMYKFQSSEKAQAQILGSGAILPEAVKAAEQLKKKYKIETNVWSVTSYKNLINDALDVEREQVRNGNKDAKAYITECLEGENGPVVAASDYMKLLPNALNKAVPGGLVSLGTDGFGRSDGRCALRKHFEVDANAITFTVLSELEAKGEFDKKKLDKARKDLGIDLDKPNPVGE
ncbi:pyruvate dehydrogenase (acetyl-transferring), homodimeric type [Pontiella agarivorans]|uniref:Pyruvate dehydrogenase E1 component n=1 Tax=Pontiella agarivorans TaxID=3038953 RepID=A0ABU5N0J2_9BACT|nr:pyruvate dehydrogenase (acetyl-transferring), homodimeric type [Pontiella agarivorans]MDZ8119962.1 pyruvate dehydrogenase (acetyl-transferring), homodimeric type [Pontiella agarivorans]